MGHMCIAISIIARFFIAVLLRFFFIVPNFSPFVNALSFAFLFLGRFGGKDKIINVFFLLWFLLHRHTPFLFFIVYAKVAAFSPVVF